MFDGYGVTATTPPATVSSPGHGSRQFVFQNLPAGVSTLDIEVVSTAEGLAAPVLTIGDADTGRPFAEARMQTAAPPPNPGPVSALRISKLGLAAAVVPTQWEPPPFVVGQLASSANIEQGNTVLVGHLTGVAGNVVHTLDELVPGDTVVAVSRGVEHTFMVSDTQVRPAEDTELTAAMSTPRLTLMTCIGTWDPIARDYSDRLWVIAEPPELAAITIANTAAHPRPTPTVPASERR